MADYTNLLRDLLARSEKGLVNWHPGSSTNTYSVALRANTIEVGSGKSIGDVESHYYMRLLDEHAAAVDYVWYDEGPNCAALLRIHRLAKEQVLGIPDMIKRIETELNKTGRIGAAAPQKKAGETPEGKDIPF